ncbi:MAG: sulfotransferase domain-containing protein [Gammaproteobacteria bacterium]|nr:sulfotransferase domain-containing protein [Gammaproteobacteria bacterium]
MTQKLNKTNIIWLASYPRSGNTLLRTVLWHCFGLRSASPYPEDLGGNKELANYIGHIDISELEFVGPDQRIRFPGDAMLLFKTHQLPSDPNPAIYVVRDGRAACVSLWRFYRGQVTLETVIAGQHAFGAWADHVAAWRPWERPNTLLVRYEDMTGNLPHVLEGISAFLKRDIVKATIPDRNILANLEGRWVRGKSDWRSNMTDAQLELFDKTNGDMLRRLGYSSS